MTRGTKAHVAYVTHPCRSSGARARLTQVTMFVHDPWKTKGGAQHDLHDHAEPVEMKVELNMTWMIQLSYTCWRLILWLSWARHVEWWVHGRAELTKLKGKLMTELSLACWRMGWAEHAEGGSHGRAELDKLKGKLMVELSCACWRRRSWSSWAGLAEGKAHARAEVGMLEEELKGEMSWPSWA
jgi:hypothetical protein